jgi:hypothetical protein
MSRFRRALAGAAMAVAMAGGGMVAAMAGAAPAHAATMPAPAAVSHTFGFTVAPAAQAGGGIGPKFQCGETCGDPPPPAPSGPTIITCTLFIPNASIDAALGFITFRADTMCDGTLPQISQTQLVSYNGSPKKYDTDEPNFPRSEAHTRSVVDCQTGQWEQSVHVLLTLPPGWVVIAGTNPIISIASFAMNCGGGGVGGGGCATGTPSVPAQPAARLPMVVTCP